MSDPIQRLEQIQEELEALGQEAAEIFKNNFPSLYEQGDAYGAFAVG